MKKWFAISFILCITLGIFSLSLQDAETSNSLSVAVTQAIIGEVSSEPSASVLSLNHFIRELAHVFEYFILSFGVVGALSFLSRRLKICSLLTAFYIFLVSIIDESIQFIFSPGRAFQFIDLIKDWIGLTLGIVCFAVLYKIYSLIYPKFNHDH